MESNGFVGPWEDLKRTLCDELTTDEFKVVLFLMKEKLGPEFPGLWQNDNPMDLFTFLENSVAEFEALQVLKHVFAVMSYHPQFCSVSVKDIIETYEKKTREFEEKFKLYREIHFVGRQNEMDIIKEYLLSVNSCIGVWISGEGGMGKTTIAAEICYRLHLYHNFNIVNVVLKGKTNVTDLARTILMARNESWSSTDRNTLSKQAVSSVLKLDVDTILLLDNIEDCLLNDANDAIAFLQELTNSLPNCVRILVTSRVEIEEIQVIGLEEVQRIVFDRFQKVRLEPLKQEDATKLLRLTAKPRQLSNDECESLLSFSGCTPLPIRILSRTLHEFAQLPLEDVVRSAMAREMSPVFEVIKYSFNRLGPKYQEILQCLSEFGNSFFAVDEVMLMTQQTEKDTIMSLLYLRYKNLLELEELSIDINDKMTIRLIYYLHPLVLSFLNELKKKQPSEIHDRADRRFLELMLKKIESVEDIHNERASEAFSIFRDRLPTVKALFEHLTSQPAAFSISRNSYLHKLSVFYGSPEERIKLLDTLASKHMSEGNEEAGLYYYIVTASTCIDDGDFDQGERYLRDVETCIDPNSISLNTNMAYVLGEYFLTKGRINNHKDEYSEAEENLQKAQDLYRHSGDISKRFSEVARTLNALGTVYFKLKNYEKSLKYHQGACDVMKAHLFDHNHQDLTVYIFNLGTVRAMEAELMRDTDREIANRLYVEALSDFNSSLAIDETLNMRQFPSYPTKLLQRAALHHRMGNYDEAIADGQEAIKLREKIYSENHTLISEAYYKLADLFYKRSQNKKEGTKESRSKNLKEAYRLCIEIEKQIRRGSYRNQKKDCEPILRLYEDIVTDIRSKSVMAEVKVFCNDFRTDRLFDDSSDETSCSTPRSSKSSSSSSDDEIEICRRDSGLVESVSTADDADVAFRQASTESDVFMADEQESNQSRRKSIKRQRSFDSD